MNFDDRHEAKLDAKARRFELNCESAADLLHLYVELELDDVRAGQLQQHLASCSSCAAELEELRSEQAWLLESGLLSSGPESHAPSLPENFGAKLMAELDRGEQVASDRRELQRFRKWSRIASVAAILLATFFAGLWSGAGLWNDSDPWNSSDPWNDSDPAENRGSTIALRPTTAPENPISEQPLHGDETESTRLRPHGAELVRGDELARGVSERRTFIPASAGAAISAAVFTECSNYDLDLRDPLEEAVDDSIDPVLPSTHLVCASCVPEFQGATTAVAMVGSSDIDALIRNSSRRLSDAVRAVEVAFKEGEAEPCFDPNDDGKTDPADAVYVLHHLMGAGASVEGDLAMRDLIDESNAGSAREDDENNPCVEESCG